MTDDNKKKKIIIVSGATATGKSDLSIMLAKKLSGSIISADSVQVYKGQDIGSAKLPAGERGGIEHFLIDILTPDEPFNVSEFVKRSKEALDIIYSENRIPIVAGGTAFYIQALLKDVDFDERSGEDPEFRNIASDIATAGNELDFVGFAQKYFDMHREISLKIFAGCNDGKEALYRLLRSKDEKSAEIIHENNVKRVIRALEFYAMTGTPISEHNEREAGKEPEYDFVYFVLNDDRKKLYDRINDRVDKMLRDGLEEEVRKLLDAGYDRNSPGLQAIGYAQMVDHILGDTDYDAAVEKIKQETRHFAKRQITWFKREKDAVFVDIEKYGYDKEVILEHMLDVIDEKSRERISLKDG